MGGIDVEIGLVGVGLADGEAIVAHVVAGIMREGLRHVVLVLRDSGVAM